MFREFFDRLRQQTDIQKPADLARALDIAPSNVSRAAKKNSVPNEWHFKLANKYGLRAEWLRTGQGEPRSGGLLIAGQPLDVMRGGRDPNGFSVETLPRPGSISAMLWEHELRFLELDMPESQIAEQLRSILGARAAQARKREAEEQSYQVRESDPGYGKVQEDPARYAEPDTDYPQKMPPMDLPPRRKDEDERKRKTDRP